MSYYDKDRPRGDQGYKKSRAKLNDYWVDGKGIHPDVIHREIEKYLGPEASAESATNKGVQGYLVTAVRPFTSHMLDDLQRMSDSYNSGSRRPDRYSGVSSYQTSNPTYDQPYPQTPELTHTPYSPVNPQAGYPPPSPYPSSQSGYPLPSIHRYGVASGYQSQSEYQQYSGDPQQIDYGYCPPFDPNQGGGNSGSAHSTYLARDEYRHSNSGIPNKSVYQTPQAPYGSKGQYGPIGPGTIPPSQTTRPPSTTQQPYSSAIPGYSSSGHQSPPISELRCPDCGYTSGRLSDMNNHRLSHYHGDSTGRR